MDSRFSPANSFIRATRSVSFASVESIPLPLLRKIHELHLPTAAGAAAATTPAAKTAKSSASAGTASEPASTTEHATDHGADPPAATSAATSAGTGGASSHGRDDMNDEENKDKDGPNGERGGIVIPPAHGHGWRRSGKRYAAIIGDVFGELPSGGFDAAAVISLAKKWNHGAACITGARVIDDRLETVADFGPIFALGGRDEKQDAEIFFFAADAELLEEFVAVLFDGFAFERADRDDG